MRSSETPEVSLAIVMMQKERLYIEGNKNNIDGKQRCMAEVVVTDLTDTTGIHTGGQKREIMEIGEV